MPRGPSKFFMKPAEKSGRCSRVAQNRERRYKSKLLLQVTTDMFHRRFRSQQICFIC